jgi:hypothetical protein
MQASGREPIGPTDDPRCELPVSRIVLGVATRSRGTAMRKRNVALHLMA